MASVSEPVSESVSECECASVTGAILVRYVSTGSSPGPPSGEKATLPSCVDP